MSYQPTLFEEKAAEPLAARLRPRDLSEFCGQEHLLGEKKVLRRIIESDTVGSMIFWGPPGVGKTTLARIIANKTKARFIDFSAVTSGIKEIKQVMEQAETARRFGEKTIVCVDEIHRFNKAQQDAFLPYVERGSIILIGATTENPSFEVNGALLSRCKVFVLQALKTEDIIRLLRHALTDKRGFGDQQVEISDETVAMIANFANGDARSALTTLEMAVLNGDMDEHGKITVSRETVEECTSKKSLLYDKNGEEHYNLSEDVGLADPQALTVCISAFEACRLIGMPECSVHLTEAVVYLSLAPKSNALYTAYESAKRDALTMLSEPVPLVIRNAPTKLMKELDYGKGYEYAHDSADKLTSMQCLPDSLAGKEYYRPTEEGKEARFRARLEEIKEWKKRHTK